MDSLITITVAVSHRPHSTFYGSTPSFTRSLSTVVNDCVIRDLWEPTIPRKDLAFAEF